MFLCGCRELGHSSSFRRLRSWFRRLTSRNRWDSTVLWHRMDEGRRCNLVPPRPCHHRENWGRVPRRDSRSPSRTISTRWNLGIYRSKTHPDLSSVRRFLLSMLGPSHSRHPLLGSHAATPRSSGGVSSRRRRCLRGRRKSILRWSIARERLCPRSSNRRRCFSERTTGRIKSREVARRSRPSWSSSKGHMMRWCIGRRWGLL